MEQHKLANVNNLLYTIGHMKTVIAETGFVDTQEKDCD